MLPTLRLWIVFTIFGLIAAAFLGLTDSRAEESASIPAAKIDGTEFGWRALTGNDFTQVNCDPDTWTWSDQLATCTGTPIGVIRSKQQFTNFELLASWRHLKEGGNSGIFIWTDGKSLENLGRDELPGCGVEVQVLDHGFTARYAAEGHKTDWFTTHGDIFPVGTAKMKPFPPVSPRGDRSFPRKKFSKGVGEWNHYYIRAINGEVRLWVNGHEVSGGNQCTPSTGYLCLESEGAPVEFDKLRIRELP
jgi:hypothetical protein